MHISSLVTRGFTRLFVMQCGGPLLVLRVVSSACHCYWRMIAVSIALCERRLLVSPACEQGSYRTAYGHNKPLQTWWPDM